MALFAYGCLFTEFEHPLERAYTSIQGASFPQQEEIVLRFSYNLFLISDMASLHHEVMISAYMSEVVTGDSEGAATSHLTGLG